MASKNGKHKSAPMPTPAMEWRKLYEESKRGYVLMLSSGFAVRLRPVSIEQMLRRGEIPDFLSPLAAKTAIAEVPTADLAETMESVGNTFSLLDFICELALLEPRIVEEPTADDEISIEYLDTADKFEIFQLVTQPGWVLRKFRDAQNADVEPVQNSDGVQTTAVEPAAGGRPTHNPT